MDFQLSEMQQMLFDSAERFARDHYSIEQRRSLRETADGLDRDAWSQFAALGWLALPIAEDQGGLGGSLDDVAVLMTAIGAGLATEPYVSTAVLGAHMLARGDNAALRDRELPLIATGARRIALAHDEPGDRYAYDGPRLCALKPGGNGFRLDGQKMLVLDAPSADRLIVSADMEGAGVALVLVDPASEGVSHDTYPLIDGSRAADIRFDSVAVASDDILASPAIGSALLGEAVDRATIALMAQAIGSMEATLEICSAYLKERHQFGQPIGKFQALQHIMADMFVAAHQSRSALYHALAHAGRDAASRARAVSLAKLTVGDAAQFVSRSAIQLHGGYGMTDEYPVSHHFRRLLVIEKLYGDAEFHARRAMVKA